LDRGQLCCFSMKLLIFSPEPPIPGLANIPSDLPVWNVKCQPIALPTALSAAICGYTAFAS
jgi:hypothetical protein